MCSRNDVTNPVPFFVGAEPEIEEPRFVRPDRKPAERPEMPVPGVINGQIFPGECDALYFRAKKGEVITFETRARELVPFIGDGVPGHFQAVLEIRDAQNKQLAFADDRYFHPDPVMKFTVPADGKYTLLVRDALHRGRNDFVYRIEIDKNPRPYPIFAPPRFAVEPIKLAKNAKQILTAPAVIHGVFDKPGEKHTYCFKAKAGEKIVVDSWARRLNSPIDGLLEIYDPDNKRILVCDDVKRQRIGNIMQHTDPTLIFTAAKNGTYKAVFSDNAGAGGKDYQYYLRIDNPRPDFRIYAYPSSLAAAGRGTLGVIVERFDGFDGPVTLKMHNKEGFRLCGETTVPAGVSEATFTIDSSSVRSGKLTTARLEGSSNGITRKVVPATQAMQAFAYNHLIPCEGDFFISRNGRHWASVYINWKDRNPPALKLYPGTSSTITVSTVNWLPPDFEITGMSLMDQPLGVLIGDVKYKNGIATATIKVTADAKPVSVNQVIMVNISYSYKYRDKKTKVISKRKASVVALLPARRLIVAVPEK
jgi:hypothetical protein